jgi:hypothetical protein
MWLTNRFAAHSFLWISLSLIFVTSSFAQDKQSVWGDAKNGFILSYRPNVGDSYVYIIEQTAENTNIMEGRDRSSEAEKPNGSISKFVFELETKKVDSLISFILTVDTIAYSFIGPEGTTAIDYGDIKGKKAHAIMTPKGEQRDMVAIDSFPTPKTGDQPIKGVKKGAKLPGLILPLIKVPDKPIKLGDTWYETKLDTNTHIDTTHQSTHMLFHDSKIKYSVLGEEKKMGLTCLCLKVEVKYSRKSQIKMQNFETNSEGKGEVTSNLWFAYKKGVLVEYNTTDFFEEIGRSAQTNMTSLHKSKIETSLKLVKWTPVKK